MAEWSDFGWKQLADETQAWMRGQGATVFSKSSDRYSSRMFWLSMILLVLTMAQAAAVIKAWM